MRNSFQTAETYLSISGGSLDAAVSLYFEDPTLAGGPDPSSSTSMNQMNQGAGDQSAMDSSFASSSHMSDSELASQMASQMDDGIDGVRKPDAVKKESLVGGFGMGGAMMGGISGMGMMGGFGGMGMGMDMKMSGEDICARHKAMHAMGGRGVAGNTNSKDTWGDVSVGGGKASAKKTPTPAKPKKKKKEKEGNNDNGNDSDGSYEYNDESDIEDDVDAASKPPPAPAPKIHSRDQTLSDMFSPPDKILYDGVFQDARQFAKAQSKWLLVNIQRESDFACHALNRDVWKDGVVESIIADSFVFWQCDVDSTNREVSTLE